MQIKIVIIQNPEWDHFVWKLHATCEAKNEKISIGSEIDGWINWIQLEFNDYESLILEL